MKLNKLASCCALIMAIPAFAQDAGQESGNPLITSTTEVQNTTVAPSMDDFVKNNPLNGSMSMSNGSNLKSSPFTSQNSLPLGPTQSLSQTDPNLQNAAQQQALDKLQAEIAKLQLENKKLKDKEKIESLKIPSVPSKVLSQNVPKYTVNGSGTQSSGAADNEIFVKPGVNQVITIAIGHTNRIVTPFNHPQVSTSTLTTGDGGEVSVKDNVVYVSTAKNIPLSMFITEKGQENLSISLTLVPRKIPSREVSVQFKDSNVSMRLSSEDAEAWEKNQPFESGTNKTLREIALKNIPAGYNLTNIPKGYALPRCRVQGFDVDFSRGQLIAGSKLHVLVGKVTNTSKNVLEFKEAGCGDYDVAGVALFPTNIFNPGDSAEIYVVKHSQGRQEVKQVRTSVLDK